ncbi:glycosyltransferase family 2 protein [Syntrophus aciditrophicus]|uniref:Glycosyltransferase involved in cell wall biogenesis n=1 Tax=Syntrophus aciditrophicus (strain SB) TaxID=56780 RepID=Q2LVN9_SYNAS|nr:glycosyltransferase family 2 protein [Syntrophus aciditrophicus]ABC78152.1 glycosyltransferase involved in cell wall biogenesis [Syntrophus aciditrophicus SB]OPY16206.1 MAG: PGL/p-HBAD biosynthesis glycosyltransferase [Syntrophus sp. PtaB.Bin075]
MKLDSLFFSIITASLNCVDTIRETIDSVAEQTFPYVEHIVIDGGSTDGTVDVIQDATLHNQSHKIYCFSESDEGIADALNKGLYKAKGKYILVLQADDRLIDHDILKKVYAVIGDETYDIVSFPVLKMNSNGKRIPFNPIKLPWWYHFKTVFPHQGAFVHSRLFEQTGSFKKELTIALDYDFFYRALDSTGCSVLIQSMPVAVSGCDGISSNPNYLKKRLLEECLIQETNEKKLRWKIMQRIFRRIYVPYKLFSTGLKVHFLLK